MLTNATAIIIPVFAIGYLLIVYGLLSLAKLTEGRNRSRPET